MKTRIIHTKIWKDRYFASLAEAEKLVFLYLISNERVNISGIYEITDREICFDTNVMETILKAIKDKLQKDEKFFFYDDWVVIINLHKYQNYTGEKNQCALTRELQFVPKPLSKILNDIRYQYPIDTLSSNDDTLINQKPETNIKKEENEDQKSQTKTNKEKARETIEEIRKGLSKNNSI
jgi:hypothetical protein